MAVEGVNAGDRRRLQNAMQKIQDSRIDPGKFPFVIDFGGSKATVTFNCFNTITATRAAARAYWSTELQRRFLPQELQEAQGSNSSKYDTSMMSVHELGRMIGNAISVPVFADILREILW